jgi:hypothetical protein
MPPRKSQRSRQTIKNSALGTLAHPNTYLTSWRDIEMTEHEAPQEAKKSNTTRNIVIAVVVLLFLCCCCVAVSYGISSTGILEEFANELNF